MATPAERFNNFLYAVSLEYSEYKHVLVKDDGRKSHYEFVEAGFFGKIRMKMLKSISGYKEIGSGEFAERISKSVVTFLQDPKHAHNTQDKEQMAKSVDLLYNKIHHRDRELNDNSAAYIVPALKAIGINPKAGAPQPARGPEGNVGGLEIRLNVRDVEATYRAMKPKLGIEAAPENAGGNLYTLLKEGLTHLYRGALTDDEVRSCLDEACKMYAQALANAADEQKGKIVGDLTREINKALYDKIFWKAVSGYHAALGPRYTFTEAMSDIRAVIDLAEGYSDQYGAPSQPIYVRRQPRGAETPEDIDANNPENYSLDQYQHGVSLERGEVYNRLTQGTIPPKHCLPIQTSIITQPINYQYPPRAP